MKKETKKNKSKKTVELEIVELETRLAPTDDPNDPHGYFGTGFSNPQEGAEC